MKKRLYYERWDLKTFLRYFTERDMLILSWFFDFRDSGKMLSCTFGQRVGYWVSYQAVIEAFPYICIRTPDAVYRRFRKYVKAGLLNLHLFKNRPYYSVNAQMLYELLRKPQKWQSEDPGQQTETVREAKQEAVILPQGRMGNVAKVGCEILTDSYANNSEVLSISYNADSNLEIKMLKLELVAAQQFTPIWRRFCDEIEDDYNERQQILDWIVKLAIKFKQTATDIIYALKEAIKRGHGGKPWYVGGIFKQVQSRRMPDFTEQPWVQAEDIAKQRLDVVGYAKSWWSDHKNKMLRICFKDEVETHWQYAVCDSIQEQILQRTGIQYSVCIAG